MIYHRKGCDVQRFNTNLVYIIGALLRDCFNVARTPLAGWVETARQAESFLRSVLDPEAIPQLTISRQATEDLADVLRATIEVHDEDEGDVLPDKDVGTFNAAYFAFNNAIALELAHAPIFLVMPKGVYDTQRLIDHASVAYGDALADIPKEAIHDTDAAGRCLAFTLPTAAGFHIARATEAVIKQYMREYGAKTKARNWSAYIKALGAVGANAKIVHHLDQIRELHRNPMIHPEETLTMEEATSLWAVCTSVSVSMIEDIRKRRSSGQGAP